MLKFTLTVIVHLPSCTLLPQDGRVEVGGRGVCCHSHLGETLALALAADSTELITHTECWHEGRALGKTLVLWLERKFLELPCD